MTKLIEQLRKIIEPIAKKNAWLMFHVGKLMHQYKDSYSGSFENLGFEIAEGLGITGYNGKWFDNAQRAYKVFTEYQATQLSKYAVPQRDIIALMYMKDRQRLINDVANGTTHPPYKFHDLLAERRRNESGEYTPPPKHHGPGDRTKEPPEMPPDADDDRLENILVNLITIYGDRVDKLMPVAKKKAAMRGSALYEA